MGKKIRWGFFGSLALLVMAIVLLLVSSLTSQQAIFSISLPLTFQGEYRYAEDEAWQSMEDANFSGMREHVYLKGSFVLMDNEESVPMALPEGITISLRMNHLFVDIQRENGEMLYQGIHASRQALRDLCSNYWIMWSSPGLQAGEVVEIHLYNPHPLSNTNAVETMLSSIRSGPLDLIKDEMAKKSTPYRIIGLGVVIIALSLIGGMLASLLLRTRLRLSGWILSLMAMAVGIVLVLLAPDTSIYSDLWVLTTYGIQLAEMAVLFLAGLFFCSICEGGVKRIAVLLTILLGIFDGMVMLLSICNVVSICEVQIAWNIAQLFSWTGYALCCLAELIRTRGRSSMRIDLICGAVYCATYIADLFLSFFGWPQTLSLGRFTFLCLMLFYLGRLIVRLIANHRASARAKKLEQELEESRIAIMLSQIQPHFLYNSLSVIRELCHKNPALAEEATIQFTQYLRGNMNALTMDCPISFSQEVAHTKSFVALSKLRFGDQLSVEFHLEADQFTLPTLTLQPIVENAIRHGIRKKEEGGTVSILSRDCGDRFEIVVQDDGVGFDPANLPQDGKPHVGLKNAEERLRRMCGGSLSVQSTVGVGTTVTITLPKSDDF